MNHPADHQEDSGALTRLITLLHRGRSWLWLVPGIPAAALTLLIMVILPPHQTLTGVGDLVFRLSPFVLAVLTVAVLPRTRFDIAGFLLAVTVYIGFVDTGMARRVLAFGAAPRTEQEAAFQPVYQWGLLTATFLVLLGLIALRIAGTSAVRVIKVGFASILVVISGLNDVTFWLTYDWPDGRPTHLGWASHIVVIVGGPPSVLTAAVFTAVHLGLAGAIMVMPVDRFVERTLTERGLAAP